MLISGESYFGKTGIVTWNIPAVSHGDVSNTPVWGMFRSFGCVQTFLEIHLGAMYTVIKRNTIRVVGSEVHNENIASSSTSPWHLWHICATLPHCWLCFDLARRAISSFIDQPYLSFFDRSSLSFSYVTSYVSRGCDDLIFSGEADGATEG